MHKGEKALVFGIGLLLVGAYLRSRRDCGGTCRTVANALTNKGTNWLLSLL
jgi:hypothetical protein